MSTQVTLKSWFRGGDPWIWMTGGAVTICVLLVAGLLGLIAVRGLAHFWPADVVQAQYAAPGQEAMGVLGEVREGELVSKARLLSAGLPVEGEQEFYQRNLFKVGNRDIYGSDFRYIVDDWLIEREYPSDITVFERLEWGNLYAWLVAVQENGVTVAEGEAAWSDLLARQRRVQKLAKQIGKIEKSEIGAVNFKLERLRLKRRGLELDGKLSAAAAADIQQQEAELGEVYKGYEEQLIQLYGDINRDKVIVRVMTGE
ncbi:MAG: phosphate ABC transporter permease PstA, partial [Oceanococcus sp.]